MPALHSETSGTSGHTPLVLINGLFADLHSWDRALPMLSGFHVLRYDGRGQGRSEKPPGPYHLDGSIEDLLHVLEAHQWPPSYFVGLSQGGSIALALAQRHPERVLGVIAADCITEVSPLMSLKLQSWMRAHQNGGPLLRFDVATPWIWGEEVVKNQPNLVAFYRDKAGDHEEHAVIALIQSALSVSIPAQKIQCPVHLIVGEQDLLTPPFVMKEIHKEITQSTFSVVPGGHASLLEHPELFETEVLPTLKEWNKGPT